MSNLAAGVVGVRQPGSNSASPVYDVPLGTVQLASSSKDGQANFDLAAGFTAPADFENQDEEEDDEGEDDDADSDDAKGKKKGKRGRSDAKGERDIKTGRRKIKIEFIEDDARRHITFSKRKAGIMKMAYERATLTGTQVLLLVVSQTGLVYTFTTPKLQALVTQAEGRNLIQACLNAPDPPSAGGDSQDESEGSEADDGVSPSESQGSSSKRAQNRKRPRTNSASKSSSASDVGVGADDDASGVQVTAKRGRGRPRKNTAAYPDAHQTPSSATSSASGVNGEHPMPPPMHQSYSDDAVPQHHQQHHQPQYTHVPSADFAQYGAGGFYTDSSGQAGTHDMSFNQQSAAGIVDANQAAWNQNMSPTGNTQAMFSNDPHHQHPAPGFNYAAANTQHFGHFNPQQVAAMQPQEIQAPRPAW